MKPKILDYKERMRNLYIEAINEGMSEDEASRYADERYADELADYGDYLYDQEKDRRLGEES